MDWEYEWIASNRRICVLKLKAEELVPLKKIVEPHLNKLIKKYDVLNDIHESGEATEKDETKRCLLGGEIDFLKQFMNS
jgi:hypothetical protein